MQQDIIRSMFEQIERLNEALSLSQTQKEMLEKKMVKKDQQMKERIQLNENLMKVFLESHSRQKQIHGSGIKLKSLPQTNPSCQKNHPLRYTTVQSISVNYRRNLYCAGFKGKMEQVTQSAACWSCQPCMVLYCIKCKDYKKHVCTFGYKLKFTQNYEFHKYLMICDICHTEEIKQGWNCQCDFDMCEVCYNKP